MREFHHWFNEQGRGETEEVDDSVWLECRGCGKSVCESMGSVESGDVGWYIEEAMEPGGTYRGVCGGSQWCMP